jgi:D-alanyl-lipoteichoic acid acyltransferase DltB (MBOAT superfamily)
MLFNTPLFFWFFATFFLLYSFVILRQSPRVYLILVSSLIFYAGWNYRFIPLLVMSGLVDYAVGRGLEKSSSPAHRRALLVASIATNLGVLAIFKYSSFAIESVADLVAALGYSVSLPTLQVVLPVGISFYTFQSLSYTIDVYRGRMAACHAPAQFLAALSFFPQLVAGPILRASQILPQIEKLPRPTWEGARHGLVLITAGLVKKSLADLLAGPVATAFDAQHAVSWLETATGAIAFAGQIYGDFSGYSDIAIGLALLFGFHIPDNFRLPYFATSPVDFWRRWHISLSTWLRDYLYIPLGGNRKRVYLNLMLTMLLGGLWHGAAWNFVAWGAYHGGLLVAQRWLQGVPAFAVWSESSALLARLVNVSLTFYLVLIGWVLFRATTLDGALDFLAVLHAPAGLPPASGPAVAIAWLSCIALGLICFIDFVVIRCGAGLERRPWLLWPLLAVGMGFTILVGESGHAFIYFQF